MATFERMSRDVRRGAALTLIVDGERVRAFDGEKVATVLLAEDRLVFRRTVREGAPRGAFCAMGVCFDCLLTIDGVSHVRGCTVAVRDGMTIDTRSTASPVRAAKGPTAGPL